MTAIVGIIYYCPKNWYYLWQRCCVCHVLFIEWDTMQ